MCIPEPLQVIPRQTVLLTELRVSELSAPPRMRTSQLASGSAAFVWSRHSQPGSERRSDAPETKMNNVTVPDAQTEP